jgi:hypothetical protein
LPDRRERIRAAIARCKAAPPSLAAWLRSPARPGILSQAAGKDDANPAKPAAVST